MSQGILMERLREAVNAQAAQLEQVDISEALVKCRLAIREGIRKSMGASQDPQTGEGWKPRKYQYPHPPLLKTMAMANAATGLGSGSIGLIQGRELKVGVSSAEIPYAPYHQFGTGRMVARPFVGASEATLDACGELIADAAITAFD